MRNIPKPIRVLVIAAVLLYVGGRLAGFSSSTIRYKVTVTVETPEGVKTGSAVREARLNTEPRILPHAGGDYYNITKGEAVAVDLGKRGVLFALMGDQDEAHDVFMMFPDKKGHTVLWRSQYPNFVRFRDLQDPKTVELMKAEDLDAASVEGVGVKEMMIEVTDETVTANILKLLPWLPEYWGKRLDGFAYDYQRAKKVFAHSLSASAFIIMEK